MDDFTRHYVGLVFHSHFLDARGDNFQRFFGEIMNLRYLGDFTQTRPWGRLGDNKCDGYLPSKRTFYQCYAPEGLEASETIKKLKEDFNGALPFQNEHFDIWVFVHNARDGRVPTWLTLELDKLRQDNPDIRIETLGYLELREEVFNLSQHHLVDLFGPLPSRKDILSLQFKDIIPLLDHLVRSAPPDDSVPKPVSPEKLEYSKLSIDTEFFLRQGMIKADLVRTYLNRTPDKEFASRVTSAFRQEYERLKTETTEPDLIFYGLRTFTQGSFTQASQTEGAVFSVLSYLFEECDIFENPPES